MNSPKSAPKLGKNKLITPKQSVHKAIPKKSGKILKLSDAKLELKNK